MWVLSWRKYALSKFATFVSIVGALVRYAGVICLFSSLIPAALICIAIGIGLHFCAEAIAKSKANKAAGAANDPAAAEAAPVVTETAPVADNTAAAAQPAPEPVQTQAVAAAQTNNSTAASGSVKCSQCGTLIPATSKFCTECGTAMKAEEPKPKKCLRCGEIVDVNGKFCSNCGYQIK